MAENLTNGSISVGWKTVAVAAITVAATLIGSFATWSLAQVEKIETRLDDHEGLSAHPAANVRISATERRIDGVEINIYRQLEILSDVITDLKTEIRELRKQLNESRSSGVPP